MNNMNGKREISINWKTCMRIAISVLIVFLCIRYWGFIEEFVALLLGGMLAIFAGLIIAYIVNIPMRFFERKLPGPTGDGTRNRGLAIALSVICAVGVVLFAAIMVIPNLVDAVVKLAIEAPAVVESLAENELLASIIPASMLAQLKSIDWQAVVNDVASWLQSGVVSSFPQIMSLFGQIGACFMGIILAFWFLG